ncbi:MAG: hypothetical protein V2I40_07170, partial [Desulfobacteraceae bacterium]|nr:hypothetical protein [Desulfobacteraceae bacterium]
MKKMLKPMLLIAATLAAAVCIVFWSALFWIKSNHGLQWVQSRINTAIPGEITIESHRLSLLKPGLDLYGVTLRDPQGLALAGFTHLSVQLDWQALWRREIRIERILLQGPWTDLALHEAVGVNLMTALVAPAQEKKTDAPTPGHTEFPFNIVLESIQLTDGRFTFTPSDDAMRLEATGLALSAQGNLMARSGSLELAVGSLRFSSPVIRPEPARVVLKAHLKGDTLSVTALDVNSGQTTLRLTGSAGRLYTTPLMDGVLAVDSQLHELKSFFNLTGDYDGHATAALNLKGSAINPEARLVLTVENGRVAGQAVDRGELIIALKDRQISIEPASWRSAAGTVTLRGTVNLREAFPTGFLATPTDVNAIAYALTLVPDIPDLGPWLKPLIDIDGAATGRVSLSGSGVTLSDISARLTAEASGKRLLAPGMDRPVDVDVNLSAQMTQGKLAISRLNASGDGVAVTGDGRFQMDDGALAGKLALTADDLSRALGVVGIPSVYGACKASLTVDGNLNRPQFSVNLASKNLKVDTYTLGDLIVDADLDHDGRLNLTTLNLHNRGSRVHGNGRLRLLPGSGGIDPDFVNALDLTLATLSADDFMETPPFDGTLDGQLHVAGPLGSLAGALSLNGKALGTNGVRVGEIDAG